MSNQYNDLERLLAVADVAEQLSISTSLVYQIIESGRLAYHRIGTGRGTIRVRQSDLDAYLEASRIQNQQQDRRPRRHRPRLKHIRI